MLDGMSVRQLNSFITKAIIDHKAERDNGDPMRNDQVRVQGCSSESTP